MFPKSKKKSIILLCTVLGAALGFAASYTRPLRYSARAVLQIPSLKEQMVARPSEVKTFLEFYQVKEGFPQSHLRFFSIGDFSRFLELTSVGTSPKAADDALNLVADLMNRKYGAPAAKFREEATGQVDELKMRSQRLAEHRGALESRAKSKESSPLAIDSIVKSEGQEAQNKNRMVELQVELASEWTKGFRLAEMMPASDEPVSPKRHIWAGFLAFVAFMASSLVLLPDWKGFVKLT